MAEERGKPFVAWMSKDGVDGCYPKGMAIRLEEGRTATGVVCDTPVVVTPLLPDDPRPGETWLLPSGEEAEILSPPYDGVVVVRATSLRGLVPIGYDADLLRRPPVLKTYRVHHDEGCRGWTSPAIRAESPEDALAKLVVREVER